MDAIWIILTGILVLIPCALLGTFLVLRKMAMVGDAISHAVLPGIVIAFLIAGHRDSLYLTLGAAMIGVFTTFLIEFFHHKARLQSDAAIGVTFTWLFALGVILISLYSGSIDLDQECVLYGEIAYVPLDLWNIPGTTKNIPRVTSTLLLVSLLVIFFVILGYKELKITSFDPEFAIVTGIAAGIWNYLLMGAVSFTTVAAFEAVGAILVVAFLVVPSATALLWSQQLKIVLFLALAFGCISVILGYFTAAIFNSSIAAWMAIWTGIFFFSSLVILQVKNRFSQKVSFQP